MDAAEHADAPRHAAELRAWLDAIAGIARSVNQARPLRDLLDSIAGTVCGLMGYDFCAVVLPDPSRQCLVIEGAHGLSAEYLASINKDHPIMLGPGPFGEGPTSRAFATRRPVSLLDILQDPIFVPWAGPAVQQGYRSLLCVPIVASSGALGVLNCYSRTVHDSSADETMLVETIANQVAIAIESTRLRCRERATIEHLEALNRALEEHQAMLERAEEIHRHLTRAALAGSGLGDIVDALVRLLDATVLIEDATGSVLAGGPRGVGAQLSPAVLVRDQPETAVLLGELGTSGRAVALPAAQPRSGHSWVAPIVVGAEQVGRVWAVGATKTPGPLELRALEHGAIVAGFELLKQRAAQEVEWRLSGDLLDDLLTNERPDTSSVMARAGQLGHDLSQPYDLLLVRVDSGAMGPAPDGTTADSPQLAGSTCRRLLALVRRMAAQSSARVLVTGRGDHVALLATADAQGRAVATQLLADTIRREAPLALGGATVSVANGGTCRPLADLRSTARAARGILDLAARTGVRDRVIPLEDFGVFRLLLQVEDTRELVRFASGVLAPLEQHDRRRSADLRLTLKAYLKHGCRPGETADALVIHPNTLAYRLRRVQELTGLELHRPDALLRLQLAILIQELADLG